MIAKFAVIIRVEFWDKWGVFESSGLTTPRLWVKFWVDLCWFE